LGAAAGPALVQFVGFWLGLPESPKWLLSKGRSEDAKRVLAFIRGREVGGGGGREPVPTPGGRDSNDSNDSNNARVNLLGDGGEDHNRVCLTPSNGGVVSPSGSKGNGDGNFRQLLSEISARPHLRRIFALGVGLQVLQQLSGINTIMYYGAPILVMCGFKASQSVELALVLALAQAAGILVSSPLFDRFGRRPLLLSSCLASGLCLCGVASAFALGIHTHRTLALGGLVLYLLSFGVGLSPGPWVVNSEIYPLRVRGIGSSAATTANWLVNYAISATFLTASKTVGKPAVFAFFALACFAGAGWLFAVLPETSGRSLEEVEQLFKRPNDEENHHQQGAYGGDDEDEDDEEEVLSQVR